MLWGRGGLDAPRRTRRPRRFASDADRSAAPGAAGGGLAHLEPAALEAPKSGNPDGIGMEACTLKS